LRLRCGNMEEANKFWLEVEEGICKFCKEGKDNLEYYVGECEEIKGWFVKLGDSKEKRIENLCNDDLGAEKSRILCRLREEKEKMKYLREERFRRVAGVCGEEEQY
jgi:hypothetical protein